MIAPEYQGRGIGKAVAEKLLAYAQSRLPPGGRTSVQLIAAGGKEDFYEKLGFRKMPGGGCGFALRRVLHGHPAEYGNGPVPRLAAARNGAVLRLQYDFCTQKP